MRVRSPSIRIPRGGSEGQSARAVPWDHDRKRRELVEKILDDDDPAIRQVVDDLAASLLAAHVAKWSPAVRDVDTRDAVRGDLRPWRLDVARGAGFANGSSRRGGR